MSRVGLSFAIIVLLCLPLANAHGQVAMKQTTKKPQPPSIAIYDGYTIQMQNRKIGEDPVIKKNIVQPIGERKTVSVLKNSTASLVACNSAWSEQAVINLKKYYASTTFPELDLWKKIATVKQLTPLSCATIDFNAYTIALIYFSLTADPVDRGDKPRSVVWISKIDKKTSSLDGLLYAGVSIESAFESKRNLTVEAIADANDDGFHEIILHDEQHAGELRSVFLFNKRGLAGKKDVPVASWD